MLGIKFSPIYEDRVSIYLKNSKVKSNGITYDFKDAPSGQEDEKKCYWLFDYRHTNQVNIILDALVEMKSIMGIDDLEFSYCYNEKEFYCQYGPICTPIHWFKV